MSNTRRTWTDRKAINKVNIIISDFRPEVGEIADIISFQREFLQRELSDTQREAYEQVWGTKGGVWDTKYHEIVLLIGMKGGKNFWAEGDVAYACYFISALKDPHEYFSKITKRPVPYTPEKTFDIVNVSSVDEAQARRAFFESVKRILRNTIDPKSGENWFEKFAGLDLREQHGDFNKREVIFPTRGEGIGGIRLLSFNSTATAPEGVHILRFYADELSRADTKASYREAKALLELGLNNTRASFPNRVGKVLEWSYPNNSDYDLTVERYQLSLANKGIFGRKYKTWEFNPSLTREMLQDAYNSDPITAKRVYECEKSIASNNFFQPYADKLDNIVDDNIKNKVKYAIKTVARETNKGISDFTTVELLTIEGDHRKRCFAIDPAKTRDRFVILGGYAETINPLKLEMFIEDKYEVVSTNIKPVVDIMIVIEPIDGKPIDYLTIGNIFAQILRAFPHTISINSDHFQNEKFRQEIIAKGISSETYFFSNSKQMQLYTLLRANVWNDNIVVAQDSHNISGKTITDLLLQEAKALMHLGNKIDHPAWGSKDIADALAILNYDLMQLDRHGTNEEFTNEKLSMLIEHYFATRLKLINSGEAEGRTEDEINEMIRERLNLTSKQFNIILDQIKLY